jgi:phospho-N-acetylmuramoyl-pentapeptide-transferase
MNFFFWFSINLLKSQSINVFLVIVTNGLLLFWEFYILSQQKKASYEIKNFLPERHLNKNFTPHVGGIFLVSSLLIIFFILKINHLIKFLLLTNHVLKTAAFNQILLVNSQDFNFNIFAINHYLSAIGMVLFFKWVWINLYLKITENNRGLLNPMIIGSIINVFLLVQVISTGTSLIFPLSMKSIFLISYNGLVYCWPGFLAIGLLMIMGKILSLIPSKTVEQYKSEVGFITTTSLLLWALINGLLTLLGYLFQPLNPWFSNNFYIFLMIQSLWVMMFPMIYGGIDDISKINGSIVQWPDKLKFFVFSMVCGLSVFNEDNQSLFLGVFKKLIPGERWWNLVVNGIIKGFVFNAIVNGVNFTDGADGLLYFSLIPFIVALVFIILTHGYLFFPYESMSFFCLNGFHWITLMAVIFIFFSIFFYFNKKPAKIFLGETGSFGLATLIFFIIMHTGLDLLFFLSFIMGFFQLLTTVLQRLSYKIFKRKLFLMAPFHHHLEKLGYSDEFILKLYFLINSIGAGLGVLIYLKKRPADLLILAESMGKNIYLFFFGSKV